MISITAPLPSGILFPLVMRSKGCGKPHRVRQLLICLKGSLFVGQDESILLFNRLQDLHRHLLPNQVLKLHMWEPR